MNSILFRWMHLAPLTVGSICRFHNSVRDYRSAEGRKQKAESRKREGVTIVTIVTG
jgi:hypothetical protein